jgi:hypothetical protein
MSYSNLFGCANDGNLAGNKIFRTFAQSSDNVLFMLEVTISWNVPDCKPGDKKDVNILEELIKAQAAVFIAEEMIKLTSATISRMLSEYGNGASPHEEFIRKIVDKYKAGSSNSIEINELKIQRMGVLDLNG